MTKLTLKGKTGLLPTLVLLLLLSSCATRYKNTLFTSDSDKVIDTLKTIYVANNQGPEDIFYKIKPGDQLAIRNLQNVEFGAQAVAGYTQSSPSAFTVDTDGEINLPVIGKVQISGLNRREATNKLQDLYSKSLLKDPIIELNIVNLKVTLLGEFKTEGNYLIEKDNTSFIEILGKAGGLTPKADARTVRIIRGDKAHPEIIYVNLKNINSLSSQKLVLQNNDIIYIEPRKIYSSTEGLQNAMTFVQPIILLLNTAVIIYNLSR